MKTTGETSRGFESEQGAASLDVLLRTASSIRVAQRALHRSTLPFSWPRAEIAPRPLTIGLSFRAEGDGAPSASAPIFRQPPAPIVAGEGLVERAPLPSPRGAATVSAPAPALVRGAPGAAPAVVPGSPGAAPEASRPTARASGDPSLGDVMPGWGLLPDRRSRPRLVDAVAAPAPTSSPAAWRMPGGAVALSIDEAPRAPAFARVDSPDGALPERSAATPTSEARGPEPIVWSGPRAKIVEGTAPPPRAGEDLPWARAEGPSLGSARGAEDPQDAPRLVEASRGGPAPLVAGLLDLRASLPDLVKREVEQEIGKAVEAISKTVAATQEPRAPVDVTSDRYLRGISERLHAEVRSDRIRREGFR